MIEQLGALMEWGLYSVPPGPRLLPVRYNVNFFKGTMPLYLISMMVYFDNYSLGAYLYLALHGMYGLIWVAKDVIFPDPSFAMKTTLSSALVMICAFFVPYAVPGYLMMREPYTPSPLKVCVTVVIYQTGLLCMVLTDAQKYLVLRERKGLITHGMMGRSRNCNYLGEMLIYFSFAFLVNNVFVYVGLVGIWIAAFVPRMLVKDLALSKKKGW